MEYTGAVKLQDMLYADRVATEVECRTWREAAQAAGALLVRAGDAEDAFIASMIETVEQFGPYVILVPGVAFFHGRPGNAVKRTCLSFLTLKTPVAFDDFGGEQIHCAFGFGAVDNSSHIEILKKVAALLQDEQFLQAACSHPTKDKLLQILSAY